MTGSAAAVARTATAATPDECGPEARRRAIDVQLAATYQGIRAGQLREQLSRARGGRARRTAALRGRPRRRERNARCACPHQRHGARALWCGC
jgi:hypothetical protein